MKRNQLAGWAMLSPVILIFLALGIFPLVYSAWLSFHRLNLLDPSRPAVPVGFGNYEQILFGHPISGITFLRSLGITAIIGGASLFLELFLGLVLAIIVSRTKASSLLRVMRTSLMVPMLIAPAIIGMMFRFLFEPSYGFINFVLSFVNIEPIYWISDPGVVLFSVVLVSVWTWLPFSFLVLLAGLNAIPQEQYEAAAVDGAGVLQQVRFIMLPWLSRLLGVLVLIRGVELIRTFDVVYTLTYGGPGVSSRTLAFSAYLTGFKYFEIGQAAAYAFLIMILINIMIILFLRHLVPAEEER